jgi:hypothetical protein
MTTAIRAPPVVAGCLVLLVSTSLGAIAQSTPSASAPATQALELHGWPGSWGRLLTFTLPGGWDSGWWITPQWA